jgi:hypothetical protein
MQIYDDKRALKIERANQTQPKRNATPPIGVMAPSPFIPVVAMI